MAQQIINIGTTPNDGTGDTLRESQRKANENFTELYGMSGGAQDIDSVLNEGSVAVDKTQTFEDSSSDNLNVLSPVGAVVTNTTDNTGYKAEGIDHTKGGFTSSVRFATPTQANTQTFPNKSGTVAMTNDIPTLKTVNGNSLIGAGDVKTPILLIADFTARSYTGAGTTTVGTYTIPANTIPANCMIRTCVRFYKTGTNLAFNTSMVSTSTPQSRLINNVNSGAVTNTFMQIGRENVIGGGKIRGFDTSGSTYHTFTANNAVYANVDFDVTIAQTFNLTITTSSTTDTIIFDFVTVELLRI